MKKFAFVICLFLFRQVLATDQEHDQIQYSGASRLLMEYPLNDYLRARTNFPKFDVERTSNYKGYSAAWSIKDSKLLLSDFNATTDSKPATIAIIFPNRKLPLFAGWFSGKLHIATGEIEYRQGELWFKDAIQLTVTNGVVISTNGLKSFRQPPAQKKRSRIQRSDSK
jgi:hypothetical protein